jgi:EmrB/QacA subfamily drug resistance transporter
MSTNSTAPSADAEGYAPADRRVTLTIAAVMFMLLLDSTILNTSLPAIARAQGIAPLALSSAITVYLLAGAAVLPLASWLADRHGQRKVFVTAIGVFTLASLLCGLAQSPLQLVMARALQGLGGGLLLPAGRAIALRGSRPQDRIAITGLLVWPMLFAPVLGPPLGGLITTYASWHWNFFLNVPIGVAGLLLVLRWVPADGAPTPRPLDKPGAAGAIAGLCLLISGLEWAAHAAGNAAERLPALLCTAAGLACLAWTARHLRRTPQPLVSLAPFGYRSFSIAAMGGTVASMSIQATPFLLPLLFQLGLGHDAVAAGAMLLPYFLGNLAMKSVTTPILQRFGFRRVLLVAGLCSTLSIAAFAAVTAQTAWLALATLLAVAGCARSMMLTAVSTLMMIELPNAQMGAGSTLSSITMQIAAALGVAVGALALALAGHLHRQAAGPVALQDFHAAFLAVAALGALALWQFWRVPQHIGTGLPAGKAA